MMSPSAALACGVDTRQLQSLYALFGPANLEHHLARVPSVVPVPPPMLDATGEAWKRWRKEARRGTDPLSCATLIKVAQQAQAQRKYAPGEDNLSGLVFAPVLSGGDNGACDSRVPALLKQLLDSRLASSLAAAQRLHDYVMRSTDAPPPSTVGGGFAFAEAEAVAEVDSLAQLCKIAAAGRAAASGGGGGGGPARAGVFLGGAAAAGAVECLLWVGAAQPSRALRVVGVDLGGSSELAAQTPRMCAFAAKAAATHFERVAAAAGDAGALAAPSLAALDAAIAATGASSLRLAFAGCGDCDAEGSEVECESSGGDEGDSDNEPSAKRRRTDAPGTEAGGGAAAAGLARCVRDLRLVASVLCALSTLSSGGSMVLRLPALATPADILPVSSSSSAGGGGAAAPATTSSALVCGIVFALYRHCRQVVFIKPLGRNGHSRARFVVCERLYEAAPPSLVAHLRDVYARTHAAAVAAAAAAAAVAGGGAAPVWPCIGLGEVGPLLGDARLLRTLASSTKQVARVRLCALLERVRLRVGGPDARGVVAPTPASLLRLPGDAVGTDMHGAAARAAVPGDHPDDEERVLRRWSPFARDVLPTLRFQ